MTEGTGRSVARWAGCGAVVAAAFLAGRLWTPGGGDRPPTVQAITSQVDGSFAVCTVPLDPTVEGFFMLDFETGDLSGGVINPATSQFATAYKHNVLKDLGFKAGQVKNPKFLLVSGIAELRRGGLPFAQSVLYVTDSSTGTTVAYGIPWNAQQPQAGAQMAQLVPLDVARPRGGGARAK